MSKSDYKKSRININDLIPDIISNTEISKSIHENLFNRFLSRDEYSRVIGVIGQPTPTSNTEFQIEELNEYAQQHQLQPIPHGRVGAVDHHLSFNDLLRRLKFLGVNIDRFDEWGNSTQVNWVPPIDVDKIINYQDYFWVSNNFKDAPQYVTVKNRCTWSSARAKQMVDTVIGVQDVTAIKSVSGNMISLSGNVQNKYTNGEHLILYTTGAPQYLVVKIIGITFNNTSLNTELTIDRGVDVDTYTNIAHTDFPIISIDGNSRQIEIAGDVTNIFSTDYAFSLVQSVGTSTTYHSVADSKFDLNHNKTIITLRENLLALNWKYASTLPQILLNKEEANITCDENYTTPLFEEWRDEYIGELVWSPNKIVVDSSIIGNGETVLGESNFYDSTKPFNTLGVRINDELNIIYGKAKGRHQILSVNQPSASEGILGVNPTEFFFTDIDNAYQIVRPKKTSTISFKTPPTTNNYLHDIYINTHDDKLYQWDGTSWIVVANNIGVIIGSTHGRHLLEFDNTSAWAIENNWVHKTQLETFESATRAQLPIIEYNPFLKQSTTSYATKEWKYRALPSSEYIEVDEQPRMFEIQRIRLTSSADEFSFIDNQRILLNEKFGNMVNDIVPEERISFNGFVDNIDEKIVSNVEFKQVFPNARYQTIITLTTPVNNVYDLPIGASLEPTKTSRGDTWKGIDANHWMFEGIVNIKASSVKPEPNEMLGELVRTDHVPRSEILDPTTGELRGNPVAYETNIGLVWQTFTYATGVEYTGAIFNLDDSLHDLALYDDYQEGDIRVYINGIRQYGNYADIQSKINPLYVGGIEFDSGTVISSRDVVRIELGEYAHNEIGKRSVDVITEYGVDSYNLVDVRLMEQIKSEKNQYLYFDIYDVDGTPKEFANNLFVYNESPDYPVNPYLLRRIVSDVSTRTFEFVNQLFDESTEELYCYYDAEYVGNELQNIWKRGLNNEQYVPRKIEGTDYWELPNQMYYNLQHRNRKVVSFRDVFRHFNSIAEAQTTPGIHSNITNLFHLDDRVNYGLGGTIKDHNDNFDMLISTMFVNNVNPLRLYQFAHDQYSANFKWVEEKFIDDFLKILNHPETKTLSEISSDMAEYLIDKFETNDKLSQWFGDSTTYNESTNTGIKNWIATTPYIGLTVPSKPHLNVDITIGLRELLHHDGHRSAISLSPALRENFHKRLQSLTDRTDAQTVSDSAEPFPDIMFGGTSKSRPAKTGDFLIRTDLKAKTRNAYRRNFANVWEIVDYENLIGETYLEIENRLYNNIPNINMRYDFYKVQNDIEYDDILEKRFTKYGMSRSIGYLYANEIFYKETDPFTWNYAHTPVPAHPITGDESLDVAGCWQALYETVYGTPYPHLEPWKLQGYTNLPGWWMTRYAHPFSTRRWTAEMWKNILKGEVPHGYDLPDGTLSNGSPGEVTTYDYVSVNIHNFPTNDGYGPDQLLPPYWNSNNSEISSVRSLYDPAANEFIESPQLDFEWGDMGREEWKWRVSSQRIYDEMITAFTLQPLKFTSQTYGIDYAEINCLKIDPRTKSPFAVRNTIYHGDLYEDGTKTFIIDGVGQWYTHYNRHENFDGTSSEFRTLWSGWDAPLSYEFASFIDTPSFFVSNPNFDITTRDYTLGVKKTPGLDLKSIFGLRAKVMSVPSKYAKNRDYGLGWTAEFYNLSPDNSEIEIYGTENYNYRVIDDLDLHGNPVGHGSTMRTFSYPITNIDITKNRGLQVVNYNQGLLLTDTTLYPDSIAPFFASVTFDGTNTINLVVKGNEAQTIDGLLTSLNTQFGEDGTALLEQGNIYIRSDTVGPGSSVSITDNGLFATANGSFASIQPPTMEPLSFDRTFVVSGNLTSEFKEHSKIKVVESSYYGGTFTVFGTFYDIANNETNILVNEDIILPSNALPPESDNKKGFIEPVDQIGFPDEWVTGTELFLNGNASAPSPLDNTVPYYLIVLNDREFQLAETPALAESGTQIKSISSGYSNTMIGRLQRTFKALNGETIDTPWRRHYSDTRNIISCPNLISLSGIQNMIDFVTGYEDRLYDIGFRNTNVDGDNYDLSTGRTNDWQFELEKFIDSLYRLRTRRQEEVLEYAVTVDSANNNIKINNSHSSWSTGTKVVIVEGDQNAILPQPFDSTFANSTPYYIIRSGHDNIFQLAYTESDARAGKYINIIDDGVGDIRVKIFKRLTVAPELEINPIKTSVWVKNSHGIMANVFDGNNLDVITTQAIFDNNRQEMHNNEIIVFRQDTESKITVTNELRLRSTDPRVNLLKYMGGMNLFYDGYEHIIRFEDYASSGSLVYDSFLGVSTRNFALEFNRQDETTYRPNVGGYTILNNGLIQNIESSVNDMRNMYDTYRTLESKTLTKSVRKSLGYSGSMDYMDDLGLNAKTQFLFWKGMIQNKGTNFATDAFVNQTLFESAKVDEFWAYKVAEFGDAKKRLYPEMTLLPEDVTRQELRLEFVLPEEGGGPASFIPIRITDTDRWWDQPDQLEKLKPDPAFWFDINVINRVENAENLIEKINNNYIIDMGHTVNAVVLTHYDSATNSIVQLKEHVDFTYMSSRVIKFIGPVVENAFSINDITVAYPQLTINEVTYFYDAINPSVLIDKTGNLVDDDLNPNAGSQSSQAFVVTEIPIWNPAFGERSILVDFVTTIKGDTDHANYTNYPDVDFSDLSPWLSDMIGTVWFDDTLEDYVPYYDKTAIPNFDQRMFLWGRLAEWGDVALYEWSQSDVPPSEWNRDGQPMTLLYKNMAADPKNDVPTWVLNPEPDIHEEYIAGMVTTSNTTSLTGKVDVYLNGKFNHTATILNGGYFSSYAQTVPQETHIHLIKRGYVPTAQDLEINAYKFDTPYAAEHRYDVDSGEKTTLYYFWVRNRTTPHKTNTGSITLLEAEKEARGMRRPYMIIDGLRDSDFGYGIIYGSTFDSFDYDLPNRFTQVIIKGLHSTVKEESRYTLRFTRDFTLRDKLDDHLSLKNIHEEWKLFRENQLSKIDLYLWEKIITAMTGNPVRNKIVDVSRTLPTLNRVLYDELYQKDSQYGLGEEQVFTDGKLAISTIESILNNTTRKFTGIDIDAFRASYSFNTKSDIVNTMYDIYNTFSTDDVNYIFFQILRDAFSLKREFSDILKTSWVALQISQNVPIPKNTTLTPIVLQPGGDCSLPIADIPDVEILPPLPSASVTPTPTVTPTSTVTPTQTVTPTITPTQTVTPTSTVTPTMTVTPTPSGAVQAVQQEWAIHRMGNNYRYVRIYNLTTTPAIQTLYTYANPNASAHSVASDGQMIFVPAAASLMQQLTWDGAAFQFRNNIDLAGGNGANYHNLVPNTATKRLLSLGSPDYGWGMAPALYDGPPGYGATPGAAYKPASDQWTRMLDFRVETDEGYGDTVVTYGSAASMRSLTFSGNTPTNHGTLTAISTGSPPAWDRDTGLIAEINGTTSVKLSQLNMSTRALTLIGTGTLGAATDRAVFCKGFFLALGTDGRWRTYTVSGTTFTLIDTSAATYSFGSRYGIVVSPYTEVCFMTGSLLQSTIRLSDSGVITVSAGTLASTYSYDVVFLPSPLAVT